ncbi:MAG: MoxR family ATPase [Chloroflexi bacterium]|nr:MoxR family ATPase [Chloroflexota bacterium]MDA1229013.1 MoxR family ATPase [Chloroflexota bacterium]
MSTSTQVMNTESGAPVGQLDQQRFQQLLQALVSNISSSVVISEESIRYVLLGLVSQGHILLEDTPGVGKTLMAKTLAQSVQGRFSRVQCTPDLLPSDITGTSIFNMQQNHFEFKPGPVFSNVLIADEINRTGPRTQAALLEAMAEFQVSADGDVYPLPRPFMVVATQNMVESHGIFPLPDSQLDRFLIRMSLGLPSPAQEIEILSRAEHGFKSTSAVLTTQDVLAMQATVRQIQVALPVKEYLVNISQATREHPQVSRGVSPRGTVLLQSAAQGWAAFEGRDFLIPEDVKKVAPLVLPHRIASHPGSDMDNREIVQEILDKIAVPV